MNKKIFRDFRFWILFAGVVVLILSRIFYYLGEEPPCPLFIGNQEISNCDYSPKLTILIFELSGYILSIGVLLVFFAFILYAARYISRRIGQK